MTKNIKKSNNTSNNKKNLPTKTQPNKKPLPKVNSSNLNTTAKAKSTSKKGSKINLAITFFGLLLVLIVGTQIALNPKPKKATTTKAQTTNESTTAQTPSYPYFNNINTTFSSIFLSELNNYRETKELGELQRVRSIAKGTTVTLQIPDIEQVAKTQNLNTETLLAKGVLHKFLESSNNVVIATATVPTVFLNTEMINGTLTLTVTVPYEKSAHQPQNNSQTEQQVQQPSQPQQQPSQPQQQPSQPQQQQQQQPSQPQQQEPQQQEPRVRHHEHYNDSESSNENTSNRNNNNPNISNSQNDTNTGDVSPSQSRQQ